MIKIVSNIKIKMLGRTTVDMRVGSIIMEPILPHGSSELILLSVLVPVNSDVVERTFVCLRKGEKVDTDQDHVFIGPVEFLDGKEGPVYVFEEVTNEDEEDYRRLPERW